MKEIFTFGSDASNVNKGSLEKFKIQNLKFKIKKLKK
jgi:hypothetical protein